MATATMPATGRTTTENPARKSVKVLSTDTQITITLTVAQAQEIAEALASHETSWLIVPNTPKGRAGIHWAKKQFLTDGRYLIVGGKAKAHYQEGGKMNTFNKHSRIAALREKFAEILGL